MNTKTTPRFDCIDDTEPAPEGYAYAFGWNATGASFYGLVSVLDGIIIEPIYYMVVNYKLELTPSAYETFRKQFFNTAIEQLKQAM